MATTYYPPVGFSFRVEFDLGGIRDNDFRFQDVSGINVQLETTTVKEGGENRFVHTLPVRAKYPTLVLKRGLLSDSTLIEWCKDTIENLDVQPTTVWVSLLNENHEPLQTYQFINAWPQKWSLSSFNAEESKVVIETLEIAYQHFRIIDSNS
jgi:phage tail-like protein